MMKKRMTMMRINSKEMMMMRKKMQKSTAGCWSRLLDFLVMLLKVFFFVLTVLQASLCECKGLLIPEGQNILIDDFVMSIGFILCNGEFSIHQLLCRTQLLVYFGCVVVTIDWI